MIRWILVFVVWSTLTHARAQGPVDLGIQNIPQETPVWCWAAVAQQVIASSRGAETPRQCELVGMATGLGGACCAGDPRCVRTGSIPAIQALIARFGGRFSQHAPPTDAMTLHRTLARGAPIILHVRTGNVESHVVVLRGMAFQESTFGPQPVLLVNDPMALMSHAVPFEAIRRSWIDAIVVEPAHPARVHEEWDTEEVDVEEHEGTPAPRPLVPPRQPTMPAPTMPMPPGTPTPTMPAPRFAPPSTMPQVPATPMPHPCLPTPRGPICLPMPPRPAMPPMPMPPFGMPQVPPGFAPPGFPPSGSAPMMPMPPPMPPGFAPPPGFMPPRAPGAL